VNPVTKDVPSRLQSHEKKGTKRHQSDHYGDTCYIIKATLGKKGKIKLSDYMRKSEENNFRSQENNLSEN
jgi:hypothetical protein